MATPVKSNLTNKNCSDPIGSNCVTWSGPALCSTNLCGVSSITDVIVGMDNAICGNTGSSPCYTGNWISFDSSIPTSGGGTGFTWTITDFGRNFRGIAGVGTGPENIPQYKWTKDGDLKIRGTFSLNINSSIPNSFLYIPLVSIPTTCFPSSWNASQTAIISVDIYPNEGNLSGAAQRGFLTIDYPSGILYLNMSYANATGLFTHSVFMGGTTFNLA